jgi:hypothetical protein
MSVAPKESGQHCENVDETVISMKNLLTIIRKYLYECITIPLRRLTCPRAGSYRTSSVGHDYR